MRKGSITCVDRHGAYNTFYYRYSVSGIQTEQEEHRLTIFASSNYSDSEFFELTAKPKDGQLKIITIVKNNDALYGAKGIPDSAIPELAMLSGKIVRSSSHKYPSEQNEYRTNDATKVWQRLENNQKATYDQATDVYTLTEISK